MNKIFCTLIIGLSINLTLAEETISVESEKIPVATSIAKEFIQPIYLDDLINQGLLKVIDKIKETKGKVAVMDFPGLDGLSTGLSAYIANKSGNKLIEVGRQVVDRSTLEKVINEQKLQQNSLMDAATATKIGKLAGAGVFIIGSYTKTESKFVLTIRALSVELGQYIPGAVAEEILRNPSDEFNKEITELLNTKTVERVINLGSTESVNIATESIQSNKEEIEFDNLICKEININTQASKIIQIAQKSGFMSPKDMVKDWWYQDVVDEFGIKKTAISIGNWSFNYSNIWSKEAVADWVDGNSNGSQNIYGWLFVGDSSQIKDFNKCVPKPGRWNTGRGSGKNSKKK